MIVRIPEHYYKVYPVKKNGFKTTESYNNCNHISAKGLRYEICVEPLAIQELKDTRALNFSVAGESFAEVIQEFMVEHVSKTMSGYRLLQFSVFDKVGQDWISSYWKLGYGVSAYYTLEDLTYETDGSLTAYLDDLKYLAA